MKAGKKSAAVAPRRPRRRTLEPAPALLHLRSPRRPLEVLYGHAAARSLATAVELGLFAAVGSGASAEQAAARAGTDPRATRMLLDVMAALGLVRKEGARYLLTPDSADTLVAGAPGYVGEHLLLSDRYRAGWDALPEVVRTGQPLSRVDESHDARAFFPELARALYRSNAAAAERAAAKIAELGLRPRRVLDVAAGSGVWGFAVAERNPAAELSALDFPELLAIARELARERGLLGRFVELAGDLHEIELPDGGYDLVILGHILHSEGEQRARELVRRAGRALAPGGACLVCEMVPDEARRERLQPLLFALNMLMRTGSGDVFTLPELRAWLIDAGLTRVVSFDAGASSPLVLGIKPRAVRKPR